MPETEFSVRSRGRMDTTQIGDFTHRFNTDSYFGCWRSPKILKSHKNGKVGCRHKIPQQGRCVRQSPGEDAGRYADSGDSVSETVSQNSDYTVLIPVVLGNKPVRHLIQKLPQKRSAFRQNSKNRPTYPLHRLVHPLIRHSRNTLYC